MGPSRGQTPAVSDPSRGRQVTERVWNGRSTSRHEAVFPQRRGCRIFLTPMLETPLWLLFLGIATACLLVLTLTVLVTAGELRRTLQRLNVMLPETAQAVHDARRLLRQGRHLLARADAVSGYVEAVIRQACDAATDALGAVGRFKARTQALWTKRFGNGAGAEPRRHHRRR